MKICQFLFLLLLFSSDCVAIFDMYKGISDYENGKFSEAGNHFSDVLMDNPTNAAALYNLGNTAYKQGDFDGAVSLYQKSLSNFWELPEDLKKQANFNLGNANYKLERYEDAVKAYNEVLRFDPNDQNARDNRMRAEEEIIKKKMKEEAEKGAKGAKDQEDQKDRQDDQKQEPQQGSCDKCKGGGNGADAVKSQQKSQSGQPGASQDSQEQQKEQDSTEQRRTESKEQQRQEGQNGEDEQEKQDESAEGKPEDEKLDESRDEEKEPKPGEDQNKDKDEDTSAQGSENDDVEDKGQDSEDKDDAEVKQGGDDNERSGSGKDETESGRDQQLDQRVREQPVDDFKAGKREPGEDNREEKPEGIHSIQQQIGQQSDEAEDNELAKKEQEELLAVARKEEGEGERALSGRVLKLLRAVEDHDEKVNKKLIRLQVATSMGGRDGQKNW